MKLSPITGAPERETSIAEIFHENSKLRAFDIARFSWIHFVNSDFSVRNIISNPKSYYEGPAFSPRVFDADIDVQSGSRPIEDIMRARRSRRSFSDQALRFSLLAKLLRLGTGITQVQASADGTKWKLRAAPSGGGAFPLETFVYVLNVEELTPGLYYYNAPCNFIASVQKLSVEQIRSVLDEATPGTPDTNRTCAICLVLVSRLRRIAFKYGDRGYRFMLMEAGHIAQNILLLAEAEYLGAVPVGGFLDDELNGALGLNGVDEAAQYMVFVGT